MGSVEYRAIYTDIDTLVDTRIKTIELLYPKIHQELIETKAYLKRASDIIPMEKCIFDLKMIEPFYKRRKPNILLDAPPTYIFLVIARLLTDYMNSMDVNNEKNEFRLIVNAYPYKIDADIISKLLVKFTTILDGFCKIDFIYHDPNHHTLDDIRKYNVIDMIVYDGYNWLTKLLYRSNVLETSNIPDMQLVTSRPRFSLSKHPGLLRNLNLNVYSESRKHDLPVSDEQLTDMLHMIIRNQILDFDMFSYMEIDKE